MPLHETRTDDIDELFSGSTDWDGRYWQLEAGPLGYRSVRARFPRLELRWQRLARRLLWEEALVQRRLVFSVLLRADGPGRYRGQEVRPGACAIHPWGTELRSVSPSTYELLEISIAPPLMETIAPTGTPDGLLRTDPRDLKRLVQVCRGATVRAADQDGECLGSQADADQVLVALLDVLGSMRSSSTDLPGKRARAARDDSVLRSACEIMDQHVGSGALRTADLASSLGISERSLYQTFQRRIGIGPHALHLVRRMHHVRDALLTGPYSPGKAARVGRDVGISDASSLTRSYRRCFGESPRQTLLRRGRL